MAGDRPWFHMTSKRLFQITSHCPLATIRRHGNDRDCLEECLFRCASVLRNFEGRAVWRKNRAVGVETGHQGRRSQGGYFQTQTSQHHSLLANFLQGACVIIKRLQWCCAFGHLKGRGILARGNKYECAGQVLQPQSPACARAGHRPICRLCCQV